MYQYHSYVDYKESAVLPVNNCLGPFDTIEAYLSAIGNELSSIYSIFWRWTSLGLYMKWH